MVSLLASNMVIGEEQDEIKKKQRVIEHSLSTMQASALIGVAQEVDNLTYVDEHDKESFERKCSKVIT